MSTKKSNKPVIEDMQTDDHIAQACRMWDLCFNAPYDIHSAREYAEKHLHMHLGVVEDGVTTALAAVIMFQMRFGDSVVPCAGIAGVATHPSHRRKGLTRILITECMRRLDQEKVPIASLWPFSYPFYENLGWSVSDTQFKVEVQPSALQRFAKLGSPSAYREIPVSQMNKMFPLHEEWCDQWNLSLKRRPIRWERMLKTPHSNMFLLLHKEGYIVVNLKNCQDGTFDIREWCYLTPQAFVDGLALLSQLDSQYAQVRWIAGEIDNLLTLGITYPVPNISVQPGMMSRVLNVKAFEKLLPAKLDKSISIVDPLGVSDLEGGAQEVGPGQLFQTVAGIGAQPEMGPLRKLFRICGSGRPFSVEKY